MVIKVPLKIVRFDEDGIHLIINAEINGKTARLIVDTGATRTVFDTNRITKFVGKRKKSFESFDQVSVGLGTSNMESHFTTIKEFCISKLSLRNYNAILLDIANVNKSYVMLGMKPIDGVLGSDMLMDYKAVIDFKNSVLKLTI